MKYIQVSREGIGSGYIEKREHILSAIDGELLESLDDMEIGDSITLTIVDMTEEEFNNLEEFSGW